MGEAPTKRSGPRSSWSFISALKKQQLPNDLDVWSAVQPISAVEKKEAVPAGWRLVVGKDGKLLQASKTISNSIGGNEPGPDLVFERTTPEAFSFSQMALEMVKFRTRVIAAPNRAVTSVKCCLLREGKRPAVANQSGENLGSDARFTLQP